MGEFPERKLELVIAKNTNSNPNEDTKKWEELIGKPLTRIEVYSGAKVILEFDPYGALVFEPHYGYNMTASLCGELRPKPKGKVA